MKVRDLGQAILDFELNSIPKAIIGLLSIVVALAWGLFTAVVHLYKSLWFLVLLVCSGLVFFNLEEDCTYYCGLNLTPKYSIDYDFVFVVGWALVALIVAFWLDKKIYKAQQ